MDIIHNHIIRKCWGCGIARDAYRDIRLRSRVERYQPDLKKKKLQYEYLDKTLCFNCLHPYLYLEWAT